jgi:hypothetical protein
MLDTPSMGELSVAEQRYQAVLAVNERRELTEWISEPVPA